MSTTDAAYRRWAVRELTRHEKWLAGDWDSRTARGCDAAARHRAERTRLRVILFDACAYCGGTATHEPACRIMVGRGL